MLWMCGWHCDIRVHVNRSNEIRSLVAVNVSAAYFCSNDVKQKMSVLWSVLIPGSFYSSSCVTRERVKLSGSNSRKRAQFFHFSPVPFFHQIISSLLLWLCCALIFGTLPVAACEATVAVDNCAEANQGSVTSLSPQTTLVHLYKLEHIFNGLYLCI